MTQRDKVTVYYAKGGAELAQLIGFGVTRRSHVWHRIELADLGMFHAYRGGARRRQPVLSIPIEEIELRVGTQQLTTGGGWVGGGAGLTGALVGAAKAQMLNALTTHTHELVVLDVRQQLANGARRAALLTFEGMTEAALRDELLPPFYAWRDAYVNAVIAGRADRPRLAGTLDQQYATIEAMRARNTINDRHAIALNAHASRPFIAAVVTQLRDRQVDRYDVQRILAQVNDMHRAGRVSPRQVQQVTALADPILNPPQPTPPAAPPGLDDVTRIELLQTLARLRRIGALTEAEYQAEKHRLTES